MAPNSNSQAGFTVLELTIASAFMAIIMASMIVGVHSEAEGLSELATASHRKHSAQVVMQRIEEALEFAAGAAPSALLDQNMGAGDASVRVDSTAGFPPVGTLLFEPGSASEERVSFTGLDTVINTFTGLDRGVQCTSPADHANGVRVFWAGGATVLENQMGPSASQWDGQAQTAEGPLCYRGDGTGFSFRIPTDPAGGTDFFNSTGIRWGSKVGGTPSANGWSALAYVPTRQVTEADLRTDINGDGDQVDTFNLGRIHLQRWDAFTNNEPMTNVALCPPIVAQELCNFGGDMDGDGFQDPLFLWNPADGSLLIRFTTISGIHRSRAVINRIENTLYLRNGAL